MRIAVIGYGAESSTFTMHRIDTADFDIRRGADLLGMYAVDEWFSGRDDIEWVPLVRAHAGSGGPIRRGAFDALLDEVEEGLREAGPLDGVYIDLHGASSVEGLGHAEEVYVGAVRRIVGEACVIAASMDTHGNFSRELAELVDLALCFRHAPHIDAWEVRERVVRQLVEVIDRGVRPHRAWVRVPVLLPGERTSTLVEPARSVFGALLPTIERYGVYDASLWVGFAWGDEDRNAAAVLVTGDDADAAQRCAREIAARYWDAREDFAIVADQNGDLDAAFDLAASRPPAPLFISDAGDNVTAGGTGDITFALERALDRADLREAGVSVLFASITDPQAVDAAIATGEGGSAEFPVGAVVDRRFGEPVRRSWRVERLFPGTAGEGVVGALLRWESFGVIVKRTRTAFYDAQTSSGRHGRRLPGHIWFPPTEWDVVVVKNGYLFPDQRAVARSWFMATTPGGTDLDPDRLGFAQVQRPIFPLDRAFDADLTPVLLPSRG